MGSSKRSAAIVGCGVAGPALAMALQRVGVEPVIYEAYADPADDVGLFLNVASNGLDALRHIDAAELVRAAGFPTPRMVMWSGTGKRLGEIGNGLVLPDGTTSITIKRGVLHRVLREEAIRRGIRVELGKRIVDASTSASGVVLRFDDGASATASMAVGADGIRSRVRELVDPTARAPRYTGLLSLGGIATGAAVEPMPDAYQMVFGLRAFYGYVARENGEVWWFVNVAQKEDPTDQTTRPTDGEWRARLRELFLRRQGAGDASARPNGRRARCLPHPRHAHGADVASRSDGARRRRCPRDVTEWWPRRVDGIRGCRRSRKVSARCDRCHEGVRGIRTPPASASREGRPLFCTDRRSEDPGASRSLVSRPAHADRAEALRPSGSAVVDVWPPHRVGRAGGGDRRIFYRGRDWTSMGRSTVLIDLCGAVWIRRPPGPANGQWLAGSPMVGPPTVDFAI